MKTQEQITAMVDANIKKHGHHVWHVISSCPFAYTEGLHAKHGFEILAIGLPPDASHPIINGLADSLKAGWQMRLNEIIPSSTDEAPTDNIWASAAVLFRECTDPRTLEEYACGARRRNGPDARVIQLVWPDQNGLFHHQPGYDAKCAAYQTLLFQLQ